MSGDMAIVVSLLQLFATVWPREDGKTALNANIFPDFFSRNMILKSISKYNIDQAETAALIQEIHDYQMNASHETDMADGNQNCFMINLKKM